VGNGSFIKSFPWMWFMNFSGRGMDAAEYGKTKYTLIKDVEDYQPGVYDKPLPCFGCGVGWFS